MAKKNNKNNVNDLMAKLGASLKESPIKAHQRQQASAPQKSSQKAPTKTQAISAPATPTTPTQPSEAPEYNRLKQTAKQVVQASTAKSPSSKTSYRGWKTSTVGLYPEDYQNAQEIMNYIQQQTGENTNLSRAIKIALRAIKPGPHVLDINNEIKSKDGRLVSRRQF